ncbi:MAG: hypothetical protein ACP5JL_07955, partial [bacterium]
MKRVVILFLIVGVMLYNLPVFAASSSSLEDKVVVNALLSAFPDILNPDTINTLYNSGYGYGEIAIMCAIVLRNGSISLDDIKNYALSNPDLGWGEIAKHFDVNLSKLGIYHNLGKSNIRDTAIEYLLERDYGVTEETLKNLELQGVSQMDILMAYSIAAALGQGSINADTLNNILRLREQHKNWTKIMAELGTSEESIVSTLTQVRQEVKDMVKKEAQNQEQAEIQ